MQGPSYKLVTNKNLPLNRNWIQAKSQSQISKIEEELNESEAERINQKLLKQANEKEKMMKSSI
jgi:mannose/fructose-specific phosphotransferase system component IIA